MVQSWTFENHLVSDLTPNSLPVFSSGVGLDWKGDTAAAALIVSGCRTGGGCFTSQFLFETEQRRSYEVSRKVQHSKDFVALEQTREAEGFLGLRCPGTALSLTERESLHDTSIENRYFGERR